MICIFNEDDKINFELIIIAERETNEFMFLSMIEQFHFFLNIKYERKVAFAM